MGLTSKKIKAEYDIHLSSKNTYCQAEYHLKVFQVEKRLRQKFISDI